MISRRPKALSKDGLSPRMTGSIIGDALFLIIPRPLCNMLCSQLEDNHRADRDPGSLHPGAESATSPSKKEGSAYETWYGSQGQGSIRPAIARL